ncbi:MAG: MerR family transcriptional regulator [Deltaproteobacteria bacterium]|nr:MerR family transcriptional regulator [Deltaproteobacteria bacterium]
MTGEPPVAQPPAGSGEHTIDDLASVSKVPSRTIRFYQSKGLLPRPEIRGRVAYYGEPHLKRLELIASLQDRGLRIEAIRELVGRIDKGELDVGSWLGVEAELSQSWANDQPRTVSEAELFELFGSRRAGLVGDLVRAGLVERKRDVYLVSSPALLRVVGRLETAGVDLALAVAAGEILRKHLGKAAAELTDIFVKDAGSETSDTDLVGALQELRPAALEAVRIIFAQQMERSLRRLVETGRSAALPAKKRGAKR